MNLHGKLQAQSVREADGMRIAQRFIAGDERLFTNSVRETDD